MHVSYEWREHGSTAEEHSEWVEGTAAYFPP